MVAAAGWMAAWTAAVAALTPAAAVPTALGWALAFRGERGAVSALDWYDE